MHEWFTASGEHIFWSEICNNVTYVANHDPNHQVVIGCDTRATKPSTLYVVAICLISSIEPYSRVYYYGKLIDPAPVDLYARVFKEADSAVTTALSVREYSSLTRSNPNLIIHLDLSSPDKSNATSKYAKHLTSFIRSLGFNNVETKPNSWASSSIADKHTKD